MTRFIGVGVGTKQKDVILMAGKSFTETGGVKSFGRLKDLGSVATKKLMSVSGKGATKSQLTQKAITDIQSIVSAGVKPVAQTITSKTAIVSAGVLGIPKGASVQNAIQKVTPSIQSQTMGGSIKTTQLPKTKITPIMSYSTGQTISSALKQPSAQKVSSALKQPSAQKTKINQQLTSGLKIQQAQALKLKMQTVPQLKQASSIAPFISVPFPTTMKGVGTGFPKFRGIKKQKKKKGMFEVSVRRSGKFQTVGSGLSLSKAITVGKGIVSTGLGATYKLTSSGGIGGNIKTPRGFTQKKGLVFVEQRGQRLSTGGEVREIQTARRIKT